MARETGRGSLPHSDAAAGGVFRKRVPAPWRQVSRSLQTIVGCTSPGRPAGAPRAPSHTAPCGLQSRALHCSRRVFPWPPLGRFFAKVIGEVPRGLLRPVLIGRTPVTRGHAAPAGPVRNSHARSRPRPQLQKPVWGYFRILVSAPRIVWSPHEGTATTSVCGPQDTHSRQPIAPLAGPAVRLLPLLGTEWPVTLQAAGGRCGARGMPHVPGRGAFATAPCGARGQMAGPSTPPSALTELPHPDCPSRTPQGKMASLAGDSSPPECRAGFKAHVHSAAAVGGFPRSVVRVGSTLRKADTQTHAPQMGVDSSSSKGRRWVIDTLLTSKDST